MNYLVIGAGPAGLAMAKRLKDSSIDYDHVEADDNLGGNWYHGVYDTVFTDASKDVMQYPDFPMPVEYPDYLNRNQMLDYLNNFTDRFNLRDKIIFNKKVIWVEAIGNSLWKVYFQDSTIKTYRGIIICNGHHWDMNYPELPGKFEGEYYHSKKYKNPDQIKNKKILVIGSGNSAADIACEAARSGILSVISMKDSPWIFPKSFMGVPLARIKVRNSPAFINKLLVRLLLRLTFGRHEHYGLPNPAHKVFEKHPTVTEEFPYYLKHGRILPKPGIEKIEGNRVYFIDDSSEQFDIIIAATGYKLSFPFLPESLTRVEGKNLKCIGHCVYPDYRGLFFLGWQQVRGGVGALTGAFSKVIVNMIKIEEEFEIPAGAVLKEMKNKISTNHLYGSKEIFKWINNHTYQTIRKTAKKLTSNHKHENVPVGKSIPEYIGKIRVY